MSNFRRVQVIDSHTGGEPTRVVIAGGPQLEGHTVAERLAALRTHHDSFRAAVTNEPRGYEAVVGALLCEPDAASSATGVIFFNTEGYLGMCGHGTIGVIATLAYLNRIGPGNHNIETPVGLVSARLHASGEVAIANVPAYRSQRQIVVEVPGFGPVKGDVAWGGNWFFLVNQHGMELAIQHLDDLMEYAWQIRLALRAQGITGDNDQEIDHVELFGPSEMADSKNFVLCPGKAYDRSPCGTGTSAKMACLYADGKLKEGQIWRQESITGSMFEGSIRVQNGALLPTISGRAFITAESTLIFDAQDPFHAGIAK